MILIATQCFPPSVGGIETYMGGLADALTEWSNEEVRVLADGARSPEDFEAPYKIERFGGPKPMRRWSKRKSAKRHLASGRVQRVFVDSYKSIAALPTDMPARLICLAHGMEFPSNPRPQKAERMRELLSRADVILANSEYTANLTRRYLVNPRIVSVCTPPIKAQPRPSQAAIEQVEQMFRGCRPLIVALSRLEPRKGVDQLIKAIPTVSAFHPGLALAVAGAGPDRPRLEALANKTGVLDRVHFLGKISDDFKAALMSRATLFAMPTRREGDSVEGFGLVYLEAAWYGAPSLAGLEGGAADAVIDGRTGRLCDGADTDAVINTLGEMLAAPETLTTMRDDSIRWARSQVWETRIRDFLIA